MTQCLQQQLDAHHDRVSSALGGEPYPYAENYHYASQSMYAHAYRAAILIDHEAIPPQQPINAQLQHAIALELFGDINPDYLRF